jgi:Flp pilus assembly protein TadD
MSTRSIDPRLAAATALTTLLVVGCSAPMPAPPSATPAAPEPSPAAAATAPPPEQPGKVVKAQFKQAIDFMQSGKDEEASALFTNITKLDPNLASPHTNLGILFYREGKLNKAEAAFKQALQLDAKDYVAANYLGMLYRSQGRFAAAETAYKQALSANPDYGYAHLNLAILYDLYLDDLPQALDHYLRYQQLGGAGDKRLKGWLADLRQRMKSTSSGESKQ